MTKCDIIIETVSMTALLEYYGIQPNRAGKYICPFHKEKTASGNVCHNDKCFHCFGCNKTLNVINFVCEYEKCDKSTAVRLLNGFFNLGLDDLLTKEQIAEIEHKKRLNDKRKRDKSEREKKEICALRKICKNLRYWENVRVKNHPTRGQVKNGLWENDTLFFKALKNVEFYEWVHCKLTNAEHEPCRYDFCILANLTHEQLIDRIVNDKREIFV